MDAADAMTLLESKDYSLFVFCRVGPITPKESMTRGRGGEWASMSASGEPYVQKRQRLW
jgi:hypothetical protein